MDGWGMLEAVGDGWMDECWGMDGCWRQCCGMDVVGSLVKVGMDGWGMLDAGSVCCGQCCGNCGIVLYIMFTDDGATPHVPTHFPP